MEEYLQNYEFESLEKSVSCRVKNLINSAFSLKPFKTIIENRKI